jgi:hypothetical protein
MVLHYDTIECSYIKTLSILYSEYSFSKLNYLPYRNIRAERLDGNALDGEEVRMEVFTRLVVHHVSLPVEERGEGSKMFDTPRGDQGWGLLQR